MCVGGLAMTGLGSVAVYVLDPVYYVIFSVTPWSEVSSLFFPWQPLPPCLHGHGSQLCPAHITPPRHLPPKLTDPSHQDQALCMFRK